MELFVLAGLEERFYLPHYAQGYTPPDLCCGDSFPLLRNTAVFSGPLQHELESGMTARKTQGHWAMQKVVADLVIGAGT